MLRTIINVQRNSLWQLCMNWSELRTYVRIGVNCIHVLRYRFGDEEKKDESIV